MKKLIPQKIKNIYHLCQAILANFWYGKPSKKIKVIGVTGTNGKTTTVQMIAKILEEAGKKVAVASTINFKINGKEEINKTKFTTLSSFAVQKFIKKAAKNNCEYLVLEISSHSLDQYRVWGIDFDTAVITNVTREHLDYHKNMSKYRKAKLKLFKNTKTAIVNLDMKNPEEFLKCKAKNIYGYTTGISNKFLMTNLKIKKADDIELGIDYSKFKIQNSKFNLNLPGLFNIENALAAICIGISERIELEKIKKALEKIKGIPGRMEYVPNNKGINIVVDYAVTPDSLEKLYELIGIIAKNCHLEFNSGFDTNEMLNPVCRQAWQVQHGKKVKIISVFGSCGERDRGKRPIMGEIVSKNADHIFITNEDPYNEDPMQIINEVAAGVKNKTLKKDFWKILDRREAIKKALQLAKPGDFVVITGKGAEETMAIGKKRIPWNDKKVIQEVLSEL